MSGKLETMDKNRIEVADLLGKIRREITKATFLVWDVTSDYFEPLELAVDKGDRLTVQTMAESDASIAGAKSELISDILQHMTELIDTYTTTTRTPTEPAEQ